jgi:hypothetical protein
VDRNIPTSSGEQRGQFFDQPEVREAITQDPADPPLQGEAVGWRTRRRGPPLAGMGLDPRPTGSPGWGSGTSGGSQAALVSQTLLAPPGWVP